MQRGSHNQAWVEPSTPNSAAAGRTRRGRAAPAEDARGGRRGVPASHVARPGDPLLHWHVLVANLVEGADGRWSAFAHPDLYRHAGAAGEVFQAVVPGRADPHAGGGVAARAPRPGDRRRPPGLLDVFSKRRAEIDAWLAATGTPRRRRRAAGRRAGDPAQQAGAGRRTARRRLEGRGRELGWGPAQADELIAELQPRGPGRRRRGVAARRPSASTSTAPASDYERIVTPRSGSPTCCAAT